jgi:hypothetical protein
MLELLEELELLDELLLEELLDELLLEELLDELLLDELNLKHVFCAQVLHSSNALYIPPAVSQSN